MSISGDKACSLGFRGRSRGVLAASLLSVLMIICPIGRTVANPDGDATAESASVTPTVFYSAHDKSFVSSFPSLDDRHNADSRPSSPARRLSAAGRSTPQDGSDVGVYDTSLQ